MQTLYALDVAGFFLLAALSLAMVVLSLWCWRTRRPGERRWRVPVAVFALAYALQAVERYLRAVSPHQGATRAEAWGWAGTAATFLAVVLLWRSRERRPGPPPGGGRTGAA